MPELNTLDLVFVVDTTGSMGPFIDAARRQVLAMIRSVAGAEAVRLRVGLVEYRDHPPQDQLVYRIYPLDNDLSAVQRNIEKLNADGGGDAPEAVLDGVLAACQQMGWATHARRLAVLVGDAPPHGVGAAGDSFRHGCPCGQTIETVTCAAENARVTLYALGLTAAVTDSFGRLARYTGGAYFSSGQGDAAVQRLKEIVTAEFGNLEFDGRVYGQWKDAAAGFTIDVAAQSLSVAPSVVSASLSRLSARRLLERLT